MTPDDWMNEIIATITSYDLNVKFKYIPLYLAEKKCKSNIYYIKLYSYPNLVDA